MRFGGKEGHLKNEIISRAGVRTRDHVARTRYHVARTIDHVARMMIMWLELGIMWLEGGDLTIYINHPTYLVLYYFKKYLSNHGGCSSFFFHFCFTEFLNCSLLKL